MITSLSTRRARDLAGRTSKAGHGTFQRRAPGAKVAERRRGEASIHMSFRQGGRGFLMARNLLARTIFFALAGLVTTASAAFGTEAAATRPACLSASETREEISARHLMEPFAVLKGA